MICPSKKPLLEKYPFNQLEYALKGFVGNLQLKLQHIIPSMPVFFLQTGDDTYLFRKKFEHTNPKEIIQHVPRVVLKLDDFQIQQDQNSMQYNELRYHYRNTNWVCQGRRQNMLFTVSVQLVTSNFVKALQMLEISQSITSHDNTFTYEYIGVTWESSYSSVGTSKEEPSLQPSSESRNYTVVLNIELQIPIWAVRAESIRSFKEAGIGEEWFPNFDIDIDNEDGTFDHSDLDITEEDYNTETDEDSISEQVTNVSGEVKDDTNWLPKIKLETAPQEMPGSSDVPEYVIPPKMPVEMNSKQPTIELPEKD